MQMRFLRDEPISKLEQDRVRRYAFLPVLFLLCALGPPSRCSLAAQEGNPMGNDSGRQPLQTLEAGRPVVAELRKGKPDSYSIKILSGQFLHLVVEQRGVDVRVELWGPYGNKILESDRPNGTHGPEALAVVAEKTGVHKIIVSPFWAGAKGGPYEVRVVTLREPQSADLKHAAAARAYAEARSLQDRWGAAHQRTAIAKYEEALRLFRESGDAYSAALAQQDIGSTLLRLGNGKKARECFERARALYEAVPDVSAAANVLRLMGEAYIKAGNSREAMKSLDEALVRFRGVSDRSGEAVALLTLGELSLELAQYEDALQKFKAARNTARELGYRVIEAHALQNMGIACYRSEEHKHQAIPHLEEALKIYRDSGDRPAVQAALITLLNVAIGLGNNRKLEEYYSEPFYGAGTIWGSDGGLHLIAPDAPGGVGGLLSPFDKALDTFRARGNPYNIAATLNALADLHGALGRHRKALRYHHEALVISHSADYQVGKGSTLAGLMHFWKVRGSPRLAIFYGKQAVNVYQEMRDYLGGMGEKSRGSFVKSKESTYRQLAELLLMQKRPLEAQQVLNLLKEEEYSQFIQEHTEAGRHPTGRASYTTEEAAWAVEFQSRLAPLITLMREQTDQAASPAGKERRALALKAGEAELEKFYERLEREALKAPPKSEVQIPEAQELADGLRSLDHGAAVYTLLTGDSYCALVITHAAQRPYCVRMNVEELKTQIAELRNALRNPYSDPRGPSAAVYQKIFEPIAKDPLVAGAKTLLWSLDGVLRTIPITALYDPKRSEYLVERYRIGVFTLSSRVRLGDAPSRPLRGIAFGVSKEHEGLPGLLAVPGELRSIIQEEGGGEASISGKIMLDEAFTEEALTQELQHKYPVVHIASHFYFAPEGDLESFLLLGDGTRLTLSRMKELKNLFDSVELLTLSACDTAAVDPGGNGRELEGLAELAQRQGAKAVVASLWQVADDATRQLMQDFYKRVSLNQSKADALRQAQLELLKCSPSLGGLSEAERAFESYSESGQPCPDHPYYWAPFILLGNLR